MCQDETVPNSLRDYFAKNPKVAVAFSGGADSTYLLYAALESGADAVAIFVSTPFQFSGERDNAEIIAKEVGAKIVIMEADLMNDPDIISNGPERCYFCKKRILSAISKVTEDVRVPIDGTNASDDPGDRPGTKALNEFGIQSPLKICGLTKPEIRELSHKAGLSTWNRPSNSCLATRIRTGTAITNELLNTVSECETALVPLGFRDFRVRTDGTDAVLEIHPEQKTLLESEKSTVESALLKYHSTVSYRDRRPSL